jgi:hypothetical protein
MTDADDAHEFKNTAKELVAASRELIKKMDELLQAVETRVPSKDDKKKQDPTPPSP